VFGVLLVAYLALWWLHLYLFAEELSRGPGMYLGNIVNSALGIPGTKKEYVKNNISEVVKLSPEEWKSLRCCHTDNPKERPDLPPSQNECLKFQGFIPPFAENRPSILDELCTSYYGCQAIFAVANSYVLQYPEILWSMVKIAESPCSYLKKEEEISSGGATRWKGVLQEAREILDCDSSSIWFLAKRKYVVLMVSDKEKKRTMEIVIRRKDIK
jgi:hypothetical protein